MKRIIFFVLCLSVCFPFFAQEAETEINEITGFPEIKDKPFLMFNEGVSYSQITRYISQHDFNRSDFYWEDFQIGAYCEMQTGNMQPFNSLVRVEAYYPLAHRFNGMDQKSKQVLLYGVDVFAGILFQTDMWKYVRFNLALGPHFDYQLSDEYHHVELGAGALLGLELPVAKRWTILLSGLASYDYGNFGSNKKIQPYDNVWQYQLELCFRYSKKGENIYSYVKSK